ncbi:MAG: tRNA (adenosine(37)-N6)-threonylcarbamoyltransferase complex ATPase subunit type 1 TsaE [Leptospiraceae bacterium]|nr:tRNA (adenosine(37)-N6)-threonylcarbamoyltransferase complex ATPase subunit type 1 TsaE [Leptospiraceae bacterium]MDW7977133.1 tRNA (adenosine(37)-N6)-threonylcarbamoyltransferase complex ATPase subunit type 1 TsaE [Leptospiraceae bacterium]
MKGLVFEADSFSVSDTERIVKEFYKKYLENLQGAVLLLQGNLGSGKTTFCKIIGKLLGIPVEINSPSFNIYNLYAYNQKVFIHYDLYRLKQPEFEELELRELWFDLYQGQYTIHAIEWWEKAEKIESKLTRFSIQLEFLYDQPTGRRIRIFQLE